VTVDVAVVTPVFGNEATLVPLAERLAAVLDGRSWRLRFVVDASPDASLAVARGIAAGWRHVGVTALGHNVGQHRALLCGLAAEEAAAWVCLDADLQDPPEAVPALLERLSAADVGAVFAGRRGAYESKGRLAGGRLHRTALHRITGLPLDAGAFVAFGPEVRDTLLRLRPPSIVAGIGVTGVPVVSVPVERARRPVGGSAWTSAARLRQSARSLAWAAAHSQR
jgi:polyisoprenyl-phosphate glycosyltransferase